MARGPEAYLQMWERAIGVPPDSCRSDVEDLTKEDRKRLKRGMTPKDVVWALGQPSSRQGSNFTYCSEGERTTTLTFNSTGTLSSWKTRRQG